MAHTEEGEPRLLVPHHSLTGYATLGKVLNIPKTLSPHLQCGENNQLL